MQLTLERYTFPPDENSKSASIGRDGRGLGFFEYFL
jgi:hypothetical protein